MGGCPSPVNYSPVTAGHNLLPRIHTAEESEMFTQGQAARMDAALGHARMTLTRQAVAV